jgi:hypothetical protein
MLSFCFWGNIYSSYIGQTSGGGENQMALICKELINQNNFVKIIDTEISDDYNSDQIEFISLKKRINRKKKFRKIWFLFYFIKYSKNSNANIYGGRIRSSLHIIPLIIAKLKKAKFVLWLASDLDTLDYSERKKFFYSQIHNPLKKIKHIIHSEVLFKIILKHSDLIIAQHKIQMQHLKKKGLSNVHVIPNIIESKKISSINKTSNKYDYAIIGSLDKRKGALELGNILKQIPNYNFVILGKIRDSFTKKLIEELSLKNNVSYLGIKSHDDTIKIIGQTKALLHFSLMEGFPNVFIEAWSQKLPVISLYVDPGGVIEEFGLGLYCNGNLNKMIEIINNKRYKEINTKNIDIYMNRNHDAATNILKLINLLKNNHD